MDTNNLFLFSHGNGTSETEQVGLKYQSDVFSFLRSALNSLFRRQWRGKQE